MNKIALGMMCFIFIVFGFSDCFGQNDNSVARSVGRPQTMALAKIGKAKIQISNNDLRIGDLVKLDVGVLLDFDKPVYFPEDLQYRLVITDEKGASVPFETTFPMDGIGQFCLFTKTYLVDKAYFVVGCKGRASVATKAAWSAVDWEDARSAFEHGVFFPESDFCVNVAGEGKFSIHVEVYNDSLRRPDAGSDTPTAIGTISSNVLDFNVKAR